MISFKDKGDFSKLTKFLEQCRKGSEIRILENYGKRGVEALSSATPSDTGKTASSWTYEIKKTGSRATLTFLNSNMNGNVNIAIILQYGHGTGTGGWVEGRDYINPALQPVFDELADEAWREVIKV